MEREDQNARGGTREIYRRTNKLDPLAFPNAEGQQLAREEQGQIPFVFLTGYDATVIPSEYRDAVFRQKSDDTERVVAEVKRERDAGAISARTVRLN